jgi:DNA replication protein DnaC
VTLEKKCALAQFCNKAGHVGVCEITCFPYVLMHGLSGTKGVWGASNVPDKYRDCRADNLPIKEANPITYEILRRYMEDVINKVDAGIGFFMYSVPTKDNPFGTGTGKTTSAVTILNEYILRRVIQHVKREREIGEPGLFVKASEFQNWFNAQFRGSPERKEQAEERFYRRKSHMMRTELLVLDDIAIRGMTPAFESELTEIIDERDVNRRTTIFTSNLPITKVREVLGERIASRIAGMTEGLAFKGKDHRRGGVLP